MRRSHQARIELQAIDIPELAMRNLAALLPGDNTVALLHVGLARTLLVMVWKGELCNSRRFELNAQQLLSAGTMAREQLLERLGLDVQRTADAFERQFQAAALGGLWVTQEHPSLAVAEELERFVALRVKPFALKDHLDFDTQTTLLDPARGIDFVPAIGAALREEAAA
jgi:MSHA biogenesis protein MshI